MSEPSSKKPWDKCVKSLIVRFIKFNLIGTVVFLIATAIYALAFPAFGIWTWFVANAGGSVLQFSLINYFNKKKKAPFLTKAKTTKTNRAKTSISQ